MRQAGISQKKHNVVQEGNVKMDIVSLIVGLASIGLAIYSIWFANKESSQSSENYSKTKELLKEIERKADLIDRTVQMEPKADVRCG